MNYSSIPEVIKAVCEQIYRWWRFLQGPETAMQDRVEHLFFKKFNTLGGYTAEIIRKIEQ